MEITDAIITFERAKEILDYIGDTCLKLKCNKVFLDERTVIRREISPHQIMALSHNINHTDLNKIHIAFWCQEHLIDINAKRLRLFSFTNEYIIKHFSTEVEAIEWLAGNNDEIALHSQKEVNKQKQIPLLDMEIIKKKDHLRLTLFVTKLTLECVKDVLKLISEKSSHFNCNKVLLDERSIKERNISPEEIMQSSKISRQHGLHNVFTAVLCNPNLIDKNSERFSLFTFTDKHILQFFAEEAKALEWLKAQKSG